eukprot:12971433-Alexandrium_andersonii.AAC.1
MDRVYLEWVERVRLWGRRVTMMRLVSSESQCRKGLVLVSGMAGGGRELTASLMWLTSVCRCELGSVFHGIGGWE